MEFTVEYLDLILVPAGLMIMFLYHLHLIYRVMTLPATTVIGYENHNRKAWVHCMMQGDSTDQISRALSVISNNTTGAIYLASISLTLSALIGAWLGSKSRNLLMNVVILGDTSSATLSLKYISLLLTFLLAFGSFLQSTRYFFQANFFISTPNTDIPVKYVQTPMLKANNFWHVGLRLLYFAMVLLFWIFGPIPMFASCVIAVVILSFLDSNPAPLHQYFKVDKFPGKKVVEDVAAAIREAERGGMLVVGEMVSIVTAIGHHGL